MSLRMVGCLLMMIAEENAHDLFQNNNTAFVARAWGETTKVLIP